MVLSPAIPMQFDIIALQHVPPCATQTRRTNTPVLLQFVLLQLVLLQKWNLAQLATVDLFLFIRQLKYHENADRGARF